MDVKKIAHLARLKISDDEALKYQAQLNSIFKYFEEISPIDTKNVEALVTPTDMETIFREDIEKTTLTAEDAIRNSPEHSGKLFKVPPVVG